MLKNFLLYFFNTKFVYHNTKKVVLSPMSQDMQKTIEKCIQGDAGAQRVLYDRYKARFYALCLRYSSNADEAQDILIEGFLKVFNSLENYRNEGEFEGWMHRIFVNHAISYIHRKRNDVLSKNNEREIDEAILVDRNDNYTTDLKGILLHYLNCLNPKERTIFNMVAIEEYSIVEAAKELNLKKTVVKTYYYRARARLKSMLQKNEKELLREYNLYE